MCLSVPARVININGDYAEVDFAGIRKNVGITLLPEVSVGDYVLVHSGFAIEKVNEKEAEEILDLWEEIDSEGYIE